MSQQTLALVQRAVAAGLIGEEEVNQCRAALGRAVDDQSLLDHLVQRNLLTSWQAGQLRAGRVHGLFVKHYKLLAPLGTGGFGQVFRALDTQQPPRQVAVKILSRRAATPDAVSRFRREGLVALELQHEHLVRTFELGEQGGTPFLVMELVDGVTLAQHIARQVRLPYHEAARIGYQVAQALEHAWRHGVIHRDIKPSNILISRGGVAKVADLGLAKFFGARAAQAQSLQTRTGMLMGTLDYIAPEQAEDAKRADIRSDIYSLGCTLYHCLVGGPPFSGGTDVQKLVAHREYRPPPISDRNPDVPRMLAELIERRMLAKRPEERYQTPAAAAADLLFWSRPPSGAAEGLDAAAQLYSAAVAGAIPPDTRPKSRETAESSPAPAAGPAAGRGAGPTDGVPGGAMAGAPAMPAMGGMPAPVAMPGFPAPPAASGPDPTQAPMMPPGGIPGAIGGLRGGFGAPLGGPGLGGPGMGMLGMGMPEMGIPGTGAAGWQQPQRGAAPKKKEADRFLFGLIGVGALVLLVMVGLVVWSILSGGDEPVPTPTRTPTPTREPTPTPTPGPTPTPTPPATPPPPGPPVVGQPLWLSGTLAGGQTFDWSGYRGKVVLVDFFATTNDAWKQQLPALKVAHEMFQDKGFEIVGISLDDDKQALEFFRDEHELTWPILFGATPEEQGMKHPMAVQYAVQSVPTTVLVDPQGNVVAVTARASDLFEQVAAILDIPWTPSQRLAALNTAIGQWRVEPDVKGLRFAETENNKDVPTFGYSWMTDLLPHLGQEEVYNQFDFSKQWRMSPNLEVSFTEIPEFLNPADSRTRWQGLPWHGMALTHWVGMAGVQDVAVDRTMVAAELDRRDPRAGIFGYDAIARWEDITDGTSQTIMLLGAGRLASPWIQGGGATIRGARAPYFDDLGFGTVGLTKPGVQVLMADGSVKNIAADIDPKVFRALCTIHGADTVDLARQPAVTDP